jgi:hypothetical protein
MDAYLAALPTWVAFSPLLADLDMATGPSTTVEEMVGSTPYNCAVTPYSMTRTPDNPDVEVLWAGSLLQGKGYVGGIGSLEELPIRQRAPITISIDLLTGNNTRTVENPTPASVASAVGSLIQAATDAGHRAGSKIFFNQVDYHSLAEASLSAGFSASYQGVTVKANLEASASAEKSTVMAVYTQQMFTVSTELPQTPGAFFSDALTEDVLQQQENLGRIGPDNLPVFVSSIVYGQTVVFSMTASATHAEIRAALEVAALDQGVGLTQEQRALLETSEIKLVAVGGDATNAAAVIRSGNFSSYFDEDAALTTAKPISYTVRNVADNTTAHVSETTEYNVRECVEASIPVTGYEYTIKMLDVGWVERASLLCAATPAVHILAKSEFWIEDENGLTPIVDDLGGGILNSVGDRADPYPTAMSQDYTNPVTVRLHFDGRDHVRLYGEVWTAYPQWFDWREGIRFTGSIPTGIRGSSRWNRLVPPGCHRFSIRYVVTRGDPLYD